MRCRPLTQFLEKNRRNHSPKVRTVFLAVVAVVAVVAIRGDIIRHTKNKKENVGHVLEGERHATLPRRTLMGFKTAHQAGEAGCMFHSVGQRRRPLLACFYPVDTNEVLPLRFSGVLLCHGGVLASDIVTVFLFPTTMQKTTVGREG